MSIIRREQKHQTPPSGGDLAPLAVYIHWPFCKAKCPYCDFNSHVRERVDAAAWKAALLAEIDYAATLATHHKVISIFFGGGTPSLMPPDIAEAAIQRVRALWPCEDDIEITLEANPTSVEVDTFPNFKRAGINRLSLGVQSLRPHALKFLGREHSSDEALRAIALAREHFARYSFDLIYARPQQTLAEWEEELSQALALVGGHISLYQLTIEENTAFHTAYAKGAFTLPDEELAVQMYELTETLTQAHGLSAYEVSNYAAAGQESRHNLAYWRGHDYVGIGAGAHGRVQVVRCQESGVSKDSDTCHPTPDTCRTATLNIKSPEMWLAAVQSRGNGLESLAPLTPQQCAEERLMMGLRLKEGIALAEARMFIDEDKRLFAISEGLLIDSKTRLAATPKGRLVLTSLTSHLLKNS